MLKKIFFLLIISIFISCSKPAPPRIENRISFYKNEDYLKIEVKTNSDPRQYSLKFGQVYFVTGNENGKGDWRLESGYWVAETSDDLFIIKFDMNLINNIMGDNEYYVMVLLYNDRKGEELYVS